jgi:hypothetical protein
MNNKHDGSHTCTGVVEVDEWNAGVKNNATANKRSGVTFVADEAMALAVVVTIMIMTTRFLNTIWTDKVSIIQGRLWLGTT